MTLVKIIEANGDATYEVRDDDGRLVAYHGTDKPEDMEMNETIDTRALKGPRFPIPTDLADADGMVSLD